MRAFAGRDRRGAGAVLGSGAGRAAADAAVDAGGGHRPRGVHQGPEPVPRRGPPRASMYTFTLYMAALCSARALLYMYEYTLAGAPARVQ